MLLLLFIVETKNLFYCFVFFTIFSLGYDSHLIIKALANSADLPGDILIIPNNSEKYIAFIKTVKGVGYSNQNQIKFKFIDSLRFMSASLDTLASFIPSEKKHFVRSECIKSGFHSEEMFNLMNRKGVFPYEYISGYEKLDEQTLPQKESFYSSLTGTHVSEEDYKHAQNVWQKFGIKTLGEYSDLYLKIDVLLLTDIFENFRNTCMNTHALDPAHYFSAPGLSFDAMLKCTGVSIELFTDVDMLMFAEKGTRGGVSQINKRHVRANNQYMDNEFDHSKEKSFLLYLDGEYACFIYPFFFCVFIFFLSKKIFLFFFHQQTTCTDMQCPSGCQLEIISGSQRVKSIESSIHLTNKKMLLLF